MRSLLDAKDELIRQKDSEIAVLKSWSFAGRKIAMLPKTKMPSGKCSDGILYGNIGRLVSVNGVFVAQGDHLSADFGELASSSGLANTSATKFDNTRASVSLKPRVVMAATDADAGGNERFSGSFGMAFC